MKLLAIIGTAGRRDDAGRLGAQHFDAMCRAARKVMQLTECAGVISGGAAWADHIAVDLFLHGYAKRLVLCLPAPFNPQTGAYVDSGVKDFQANPGGTSNYYHRLFSERLHRKPYVTLGELGIAISRGADVLQGNGFFQRNDMVAEKADAMFACTFGVGYKLKDGGTADTWRKFRQHKPGAIAYHLDLNSCKLFASKAEATPPPCVASKPAGGTLRLAV